MRAAATVALVLAVGVGVLGTGWLRRAAPRGSPAESLAAVAAEPEPGPPPSPVRLYAVGDLMLGTSIRRGIERHGGRHPFRPFRDALREADLVFGNLETPLSHRGTPTPGKSPESLRNRTNYLFRAPTSAAEGLAWSGFDVVSLANNHAMDYGGTALRDTLDSLREAGVVAVGAGETREEAVAPVYLERNGQRFAIFAISDILPRFSVASEEVAGVAPARGEFFERFMPGALAAAREEADWVLVSVHWGRERFTGATERQRTLGRRLIDWGAHAVIGHHTHVEGPVERYGDGWIHYSLGNFISWRQPARGAPVWELIFRPGETPESRVFHLKR